MAEAAAAEISNVEGVTSFDIQSLFSSDRDFLIRNNGDQVKLETFKGKKIGLYFSASWCGPCHRFTPILTEVYNELSANPEADFEVIFVSGDQDDASFNAYLSKMPWLAIPFSDSETRTRLDEEFRVTGIPHLVILDENGKVLSDDGVEIIGEYGAEAYPFTEEKIDQLKEEEERAKWEQSLRSVLVSNWRDFVVSSDGKQIPVAQLEGKTVGLYFSYSSYKPCADFTPKLLGVYQKLKENNGGGSSFEIVWISLNEDEESFNRDFGSMPWLALPVKDKSCKKLARYFELSTLPTVVIIGPNGKTLNSNAAEAIEEFGIEAFPFNSEKVAEIEKARENSQTLESVLVSGDRDFVIGKDGSQIPVSNLIGKMILLYFSASWCPPCRAFLPKFIEAYEKMKEKDEEIEVIFVSSDRDQHSFDKLYSEMPWLALPFGDPRKSSLSRKFKVYGIPKLIAIGKDGRTVTKEARNMIAEYGADAYPFTEERLKEIENSKEGLICDGEVCRKA